ncbi:MAG: citrate lyase acyl carrier protein [Clostridiales bacterium]|nr:MAG: citrate lyase acyl carrier protein [Clostridiales bacterium]
MGKKNAKAGSLESSDLLVVIEEKEAGEKLEIVMNSIVEKQYGDRIIEIAHEIAALKGMDNVRILIQDRGALDYAIRARIETAIERYERGV